MNTDILHYILNTFKPETERHIYRDEVVIQSFNHGRTEALLFLAVHQGLVLSQARNSR